MPLPEAHAPTLGEAIHLSRIEIAAARSLIKPLAIGQEVGVVPQVLPSEARSVQRVQTGIVGGLSPVPPVHGAPLTQTNVALDPEKRMALILRQLTRGPGAITDE